jgi:SAM-dependent methyltransferase
MTNIDPRTVSSFGDEWSRLDQTGMSIIEAQTAFESYFAVFPWADLRPDAEGFDMGCGSGRWARWVAPKVGRLHCIDPSIAIDVARKNLGDLSNVSCERAGVDDHSLPPSSQDFGYSLGVLHHVPNTGQAIRSCAELLKPGAPLLLYLYYDFENRSWLFRAIWRLTDLVRQIICRLPAPLKHFVTDAIAFLVYWPLATLSRIAERLGANVNSVPLSFYRHRSFYTMRTDARDRFGTPLEQRFNRSQIRDMMERAGLTDIRFSNGEPFWCVVGLRSPSPIPFANTDCISGVRSLRP